MAYYGLGTKEAILSDLETQFKTISYQILMLLSSGYVDCIPADIGKQVKDDGVEIGLLVAYDNTLRRWMIDSTSTIASGSTITITAGTGAGTADESSIITKIKTVDFQKTDPRGASPERYPGIFINDLRTDREQKLGDIWKNIFTVVLVGFVWAQGTENLATKLNDFIVATKGKVLADPSRNSNARDTNVDTIVTDGGSYHPQGQFMMSLAIIFYSAT